MRGRVSVLIYKSACCFWLILCVIFSQYFFKISSTQDIYPFFTWNLFSEFKERKNVYFIKILAIENQKREDCFLNSCTPVITVVSKDSGLFAFSQDLGKTFVKGNKNLLAKYISHVNLVLLKNYKSAEYSLVTRKYKYDAQGKFEFFDEKKLADFRK